VSDRRLEISPQPSAAERRAIELALEQMREPAPPRPAAWQHSDQPDHAAG